MIMHTANLLSEFPPITTEQWENALRDSISDPDTSAKMIWHPEEGLSIKPYYRAEDIAELSFLDAAPGDLPYVRGTRAVPGWRIREYVEIADPEAANCKARELIAAGADEIAFVGPKIENSSHIVLLLADLDHPVNFVGLGQGGVTTIYKRLQESPYPALVSCDLDPLANLEFMAEILKSPQSMFRPFTVHAEPFNESGAGSIEEIGFTLSAAVEALAQMQERGIGVDQVAQSITFSFSIGPEFYLQIAKIRAFRMLWSQVVEAFHGNSEDGRPIVHARTARWNKTAYDPHVNILRSTTEAISAALGGADSISIAAFDDCYRPPEENSRRLARNAQLILKHEARLASVADAAGGSYLIEAISNDIALNAWKLFQELERSGGFQKARESGLVLSVLGNRESRRQEAVIQRRIALTGTNRFADASEKAYARIDPEWWGASNRVAFDIEALRLRTERAALNGILPRIVLAEIGDAKMRRARSQFVADFLGCAGLSATVHAFESVAEMQTGQADVVVLCSSDSEYRAIASELMPRVNASGRPACVLVAGSPRDKEQLVALGISDFIHIGCDAVAVFSRLQQRIGIGE